MAISLFVLLLLIPFYVGGTVDEEQLSTSGISTKHTLLAWLDLNYHFWINRVGLGVPQPFSSTLAFHPLSPLFLLNDFFIPISVIYTFHFLISAFSILVLCQRLYIERTIALLCVFTFLFSSASVQYVHADYSPTVTIGLSMFPVILFIFVKILDSKNSKQSLIYSITFGLLVGLWILNGHAGVIFMQMVCLVFFALFCTKDALSKFKWLILSVLIALLLSFDKFYQLNTEMRLFDQTLDRLANSEPFVLTARTYDMVWALMFKPFYLVNINDFFSTIQEHGYVRAIVDIKDQFVHENKGRRLTFIGPPFFILSLFPLFLEKYFPYQRAFCGAMIVSLMLMFLPSDTLGTIPSSNYQYRDSYVIFAIVLAGMALTLLNMKMKVSFKKYFRVIVVVQVLLLFVGVLTPLYTSFIAKDHDGSSKMPRSYLGYTRDMRLVDYLRSEGIGKTDRIYLSPGSQPLAPDKIVSVDTVWDTERFWGNGLALKGLTVVTGLFKPVSTNVLHPDQALMMGHIKGQADVLLNKELLDALSIRYVLATPEEPRAPGLFEVGRFMPYDGFELQVLKNEDAWPLAVFVDHDVIDTRLPRRNTCEHEQLLCADFSPIKEFRNNGDEIQIRYESGGCIQLTTEPDSKARTILLSIMHRPGWVAKTEFRNLEVIRTVEGLIAVELLPGVSEVAMSYEPIVRVVSFHLAWFTLLISIAVLVFLCISRISEEKVINRSV